MNWYVDRVSGSFTGTNVLSPDDILFYELKYTPFMYDTCFTLNYLYFWPRNPTFLISYIAKYKFYYKYLFYYS